MSKKYKCRSTGEVITGKFKEAPKLFKQKGLDWQFVLDVLDENKTRILVFSSIEEFTQKYEEELNPIYLEIRRVADLFLAEMGKS